MQFKEPNLYLTHGKRLLFFPAGGLLMNFFISLVVVKNSELRLYALIFNLSTLILIVLFMRLRCHLNRLYETIIRMVIIERQGGYLR